MTPVISRAAGAVLLLTLGLSLARSRLRPDPHPTVRLLRKVLSQVYTAMAVLRAAFFWHRSEVRRAIAAERGRWDAMVAANAQAQREREAGAAIALHRAEMANQVRLY